MTEYQYDKNIKMYDYKHWAYIEPNWYKLSLKDGDTIKINLNIQMKNALDELDVVEIRFYNICNRVTNGAIGKMYAYVDGKPALPTMDIQAYASPMYMALPLCPKYGTHKMDIWDTIDTAKPGLTEYLYKYRGSVPLVIKTIELYIVTKPKY